MNILKKANYKSYEWINSPVIGENMFREYDLRNPTIPLVKGGISVEPGINTEGMFVLGKAYGTYVKKKLNQKKIVVGCDYRQYSKGSTYAFITGALSSGTDVVDVGVVLSPIIYFSQYHFDLLGGAMITSSHNDNGWTGLKLGKGLSKTFEIDDIAEYKKLVYSGKFTKGAGHYTKYDNIEEPYYAYIENTIKPYIGTRKFKVVVSGANGGGSHFISRLVKKLGFDVMEFECNLDWDFPRYAPNPENSAFVNALGRFVMENHADLGIAIDGDGDRIGVSDETGTPIFSDRVALFITRFLIEKVPKGQKIVIDVKSTGAFSRDPIITKSGAEIVFTKTGHSYVKATSASLDALLGFEKSGHFFFRKEFGHGYDDACLSAAWCLTALSNTNKSLSELIKEQPKSYQSPTLEPSTKDDTVKYHIVDEITKNFIRIKNSGQAFAGMKVKELITMNGVRFIFEDGSWGLIRASSNQPVLVVTAESFSTRRKMYDIIEAIQKLLSEYKDIGDYDQELPPYPGEDK